jgi:hypothetical protein
MNFIPHPHKTVLDVSGNVGLSDSLKGVLLPATPIRAMVAVALPQAGLEDFISRFGTGEFVAYFGHRLHSIWHLLNLSSDRERSLKLG